jgi:hypothetical protein
MIYTKKERQELWERHPIFFAEKAHEFPCCDIPTFEMCLKCKIKDCENKREIEEALKKVKSD